MDKQAKVSKKMSQNSSGFFLCTSPPILELYNALNVQRSKDNIWEIGKSKNKRRKDHENLPDVGNVLMLGRIAQNEWVLNLWPAYAHESLPF